MTPPVQTVIASVPSLVAGGMARTLKNQNRPTPKVFRGRLSCATALLGGLRERFCQGRVHKQRLVNI